MNTRLLWAAAGAALLVGPAEAQTGPFSTPPPAVAGSAQFVTPPVFVAPTPSFFYWAPNYGPLYSGPVVDVRGAWAPQRPLIRTDGVPIAGLNTPPLQRGVRRAAVRQAPTAVLVPAFEIDPEQIRVAETAGDVMQDRPLTEATVKEIGATGVLVEYRRNGKVYTETVPHGRVFFFKAERMVTALTAPDELAEGMTVLVPLGDAAPATARPAERVTEIRKPAAATPGSTVLGTRQSLKAKAKPARKPAR
jgi:hypothetical protein